MELLPSDITLPPLYSQDGKGADAICHVKFFHPLSPWTWYVIEGSPVDAEGYYDTDKPKVDFLFFGYVVGDFPELGYFSLAELEDVEVLGIRMERDVNFKPMKLSEVKKLHGL